MCLVSGTTMPTGGGVCSVRASSLLTCGFFRRSPSGERVTWARALGAAVAQPEERDLCKEVYGSGQKNVST